jgi:hypothetical protein
MKLIDEMAEAKFKTFVVGILLCIFAIASVHYSLHKPLWGDEKYGIEHSTGRSVGKLLLRGADGQGSPSPAYYVVLKLVTPLKSNADKLGLSPTVFWRLPNLVAMLFGAILLTRARARYSAVAMLAVGLFLFAREAFTTRARRVHTRFGSSVAC